MVESPQLIPFTPQKQANSHLRDVAILPAPQSFVRQSYEVARIPVGFVLKFVLLSTWGDPHYIGLNGYVPLFPVPPKIEEEAWGSFWTVN